MSYHALLRLLDSYSHAHDPMCSAAAAGGFIDKLVESKGLDFIDKEKAKRHGMLLSIRSKIVNHLNNLSDSSRAQRERSQQPILSTKR